MNEALILRLAAEFQGFARDLHDLGCNQFAAWAAPTNPDLELVIRSRLRDGRDLDRGNAHPGSVGSDFGRLGSQVWVELGRHHRSAARHNQSLERLNIARNAIAHDDAGALARLQAAGIQLQLSTFRLWRRDLDALAGNLDAVVSDRLGNLSRRWSRWRAADLHRGERILMAKAKTPKPGDKVAVPWGLDEIVGTVTEVYGPPGGKSVMVLVPVHGPSGEVLQESEISFSVDSVKAVAAA